MPLFIVACILKKKKEKEKRKEKKRKNRKGTHKNSFSELIRLFFNIRQVSLL